MARRNAFTLIELLVVIAIVAILVAILFPVFNKARLQAKASVCQSNFKQVMMSSLLYITDYDDRYALSRYTHRLDATSANDKTWVQLILPYGHDFRVYRCPSDYTRGATSQAVFAALRDIVRATGVSALIATHNMELAGHMDRVFALKDGHLEERAAESHAY